jgi:hypothetical protein
MKQLALLALLSSLFAISGCSTTSEAVSLPFDLASTTGDAVSSSSGGDDEKSEQAQATQERYVASQINWIQRDAARGHGESLEALAQLLNEPDRVEFARWTQQHYAALFDDLQQPQDLLARIANQRTARN